MKIKNLVIIGCTIYDYEYEEEGDTLFVHGYNRFGKKLEARILAEVEQYEGRTFDLVVWKNLDV